MSVWKELWDDLGAIPAQAGLKPGSMWFAAPGTILVWCVALSYMFLKGCGRAGWIPNCLPCPCCGNPVGTRGGMGNDGWTGQAGSLHHTAGLERSRGVLHSRKPDGRKQEATINHWHWNQGWREGSAPYRMEWAREWDGGHLFLHFKNNMHHPAELIFLYYK